MSCYKLCLNPEAKLFCVVSFIWKGDYSVFVPARGTLEFSACQDLKNPWNDNKPVKISRDGQVSKLELGTSPKRH